MTKCIGCGITLQNENINTIGYTTNIENKLCERCFKLKNYGKYQTVSLDNEDYLKIINSIPSSNLVVYTTDILNLSIKIPTNLTKVILVVTKKDILPKSIKDEKIINYIKQRYPSILEVVVISTIKNYNLDYLYNRLLKYSNNKAIYLIGNTNSGKSTLINNLIKNYTENKQPNITVSMYPSTTLDKVEIKLNNLTIIDTPGLIDEGNYINIVSPKELKKITPKKEIKPRSCQVTGKGSILIDTLARIDYETKEANSFVIYTAPTISSNFISYTKNTYRDLFLNKYSLQSNQDIVLPGLGFIKFTKPISINIYTPERIKPYVRNNLI